MAGLSTNAPGLWGGFAGLLYGSTSLSTPPGFLADATPAWVLPGAALDLDFADSLGYNSRNLATTTPDSILTYTAPSTKMVYGADGVLRYAPHNLLTYSEDINQGQWFATNMTINSSTQLTFTAVNGYLNRTLRSSPSSKYELIIELSGSHPGDTFRVELLDGADGSDSGFVNVTVPASATEFTISADMTTATFSGSLMVGINRVPNGRSITVGSTVTITKMHLRRTPGDATYIPTTSAAVCSLPLDHDPITFDPLGVLIEEQRTNLQTRSQSTTGWTFTNLTGSEGGTSPDGVSPWVLLTEPVTAAVSRYAFGPAFLATAVVHTSSFFTKAGTRRYVAFRGVGNGSTFPWVVVDTVNWTVAGNGAVISYGIQEVGGGVYRVHLVYTAGATTSSPIYSGSIDATAPSTGTASIAYAGDGSTLYVWGIQTEVGAFPTSYIPTVASQVTRAADQVRILTSAFAFNASAGSLLVEFNNIDYTQTCGIAELRSAGGNLTLYRDNATYRYRTSLANLNLTLGQFLTGGAFNKEAMAYSASDFVASVNGNAVQTNSGSGAVPTVDTLAIGGSSKYGGADAINGHIKRLTYFPTRRTDADLQVLTA